ncbi:MAG: cation transporter [Chitinophagaceae bacterium]|nr:cation transporter [Chitinophagaceae bacterium]
MKTLKIFSIAALLISLSFTAIAQKNQTVTIPVSGNCGMCKTNIEKAAKKAGASKADWDTEAKTLTVTFASSTNLSKIQETVAEAGYDTRDVKATDAAYNKLHACCKYERVSAAAATEPAAHCQANCDMKDGKCTNMEACKAKGCCKDEADCKAKGCCKENKEHAAAGKDGACCGKHDAKAVAKEDGKACDKDCCKKS